MAADKKILQWDLRAMQEQFDLKSKNARERETDKAREAAQARLERLYLAERAEAAAFGSQMKALYETTDKLPLIPREFRAAMRLLVGKRTFWLDDSKQSQRNRWRKAWGRCNWGLCCSRRTVFWHCACICHDYGRQYRQGAAAAGQVWNVFRGHFVGGHAVGGTPWSRAELAAPAFHYRPVPSSSS